MAINLLGNQNGLVGMSSLNGPKLVPVGGSQAVAHPAQPMGVTAKNPASSAPVPPTTLPKTQQNPVNTPPIDTNYYMKPGESSADYTARIAQYNASKNGGSSGSTNPPTPPPNPANPDNLTYRGLLGTLVRSAQTGSPQVAAAQQAYNDALARKQQLESGIAAQYGGIESQAIPLEFQQGREQALARQYAGQEAAAQNAVTGAQTGLSNAYTGQGQTLGALYNAANLAQPNLGSIGQVPYSPVDLSQGAPLGTTQPGGVQAAGNLLGQFQGAQTVGAAPYQAQAQNTITAGTATPTAYNSIYQNALTDYTNLQQNVQNVDQFGNLLTSNMVAGGINPTDVKYANQTLAQIRGQLSSGAQAQYDTTLAALRSKVSGMLSVGGSETPTAITADAQKILDGSLPLSALNDVLGRIQTEGNILLNTQAGKVNAAKAGTQAPGTQVNQPTSSGVQGWL